MRYFHNFTLQNEHLGLAVIGVLLAGTLVFASCAQGAADTGQVSRAPVPVRVVEAQSGDLAASVSFPGEVQVTDKVELSPSTGGRVVNILVEEGQQVAAGTALAQLETDSLEAQAQQAEANVASAQAQLSRILQGARPEEVAASQAALEAMRAKLQGMLDGSRTEEIMAAGAGRSAAEAAIGTAEASMASAESRLAQLRNPSPRDIQVAQGTLRSAEAALDSSRGMLNKMLHPAEADIAAATSALETAKANYANLRDNPTTPMLEEATRKVDAAKDALLDAQRRLAGYDNQLDFAPNGPAYKAAWAAVTAARLRLEQDLARNGPPSVLLADRQILEDAWRALDAAQREVPWGVVGLSHGDYSGAQAAVQSSAQYLRDAQRDLLDLDPVPTAEQLRAAEAAIQSAESRLAQLLRPSDIDTSSARAAVEQAEAQRIIAFTRLEALKDPTPADVRAAEAAVELARSTVQRAQAEVASAQSNLVKTQAPFRDADFAGQQALIDQATQQLMLVASKYTRADLASAAAGVAQAEAALTAARIQLRNATITAPFDGVVARKYVSKGALVSPQSPVFSLVSVATQVVFNVEEASIGRVSVGQSVSLIASALGEQAYPGRVLFIAPVADSASRTFRVTAAPSAESLLRGGMFVNVSVATQTRVRALTVPRAAIIQQGSDNFVFTVENNKARLNRVTVGLTNEGIAEIMSGLTAGQMVVVQGNRNLRENDDVQIIQ